MSEVCTLMLSLFIILAFILERSKSGILYIAGAILRQEFDGKGGRF